MIRLEKNVNFLCEYGCDQKAKYQFKNGKRCCGTNFAKCPNMIQEKIERNKLRIPVKLIYIENSNHLCDYGCGQKAHYQIKNGRWCCEDFHSKCPEMRKKYKNLNKGKSCPKIKPEYIEKSNHICNTCKKEAHYQFKNGKWCCEDHHAKCSAGKTQFVEKSQKTAIKNYGSFKAAYYDTSKITIKEKYNSDNISSLDWVKEKKKETSRKNYGTDYPWQSKDQKEKQKDEIFKKYGVINISLLAEVKKKKAKTFIENYGVDNIFKAEEFKEKNKKYLLESYNITNISNVDWVKKKKINTSLKNWGADYYNQSDNYKAKIQRKIFENLKHLNLEFFDKKYVNSEFKHNWKCLRCGIEFKQYWKYIKLGYLCPKCYPQNNHGVSLSEKELYNFICDVIGEDKVENSCRNIIRNPKTNYPFELDIYIPSKKIAIEYNGLYWHSSVFNNSYYHLLKTKLCKDKGIQLIHIFEDEWIFKKDIVKSRIKQILNINISLERIHARKCEIREIDPKIKNEFLDEFHIQGKDASKIKLGAFHNNILVSVMTFGKGNISKGLKSKDKVWELNRFCSNSNYRIPGIAGKLLTYFSRNFEWKEIFSYADRRWSQGNLYYKLGFELDHITKPNYWYIKGIDRIHRFGLRKTKDEPKDIPEWILRQGEGYTRIWDCGSLKFSTVNL